MRSPLDSVALSRAGDTVTFTVAPATAWMFGCSRAGVTPYSDGCIAAYAAMAAWGADLAMLGATGTGRDIARTLAARITRESRDLAYRQRAGISVPTPTCQGSRMAKLLTT